MIPFSLQPSMISQWVAIGVAALQDLLRKHVSSIIFATVLLMIMLLNNSVPGWDPVTGAQKFSSDLIFVVA